MENTEETWQKFERMCKYHDKFFMMSDDHRIWKAGTESRDEIDRWYHELNRFDAERAKKIHDTAQPKF